MDIEYLLLLQRFRESTRDALTPFMEQISLFSVTYLVIRAAEKLLPGKRQGG